jgi:LmbE family N-acetylglucosaminyl deacetylase
MIKEKLFQKITYQFSKLNATLNLKPKEFEISPESKCLCLCPHPDDESIGMGGFLALFHDNFEVILLTDGRKGIKEKSTEETIKIREEEFHCAMKAAGIKEYSFFGAEDKKLLDNFDVLKMLDLKDFDYIFLPNIIDQHPDHKAVSLLLNKLIQNGAEIKPDVKICFYEVWSTLGMVNAFADISDVIETKKAMINCYKSQTAQKDYEYHALGLNQYRGMFKDKKYVEAFCILDKNEFQKICTLY